MNIGEALWVLWLIYWVSGALVGSFFGTLLALGTRALVKRIIRKYRGDRHV